MYIIIHDAFSQSPVYQIINQNKYNWMINVKNICKKININKLVKPKFIAKLYFAMYLQIPIFKYNIYDIRVFKREKNRH